MRSARMAQPTGPYLPGWRSGMAATAWTPGNPAACWSGSVALPSIQDLDEAKTWIGAQPSPLGEVPIEKLSEDLGIVGARSAGIAIADLSARVPKRRG